MPPIGGAELAKYNLRNKVLARKGFDHDEAKNVPGYVTKQNGYYYYDWGKIKIGSKVKRTNTGAAYVDVISFNDTSGKDTIVSLTSDKPFNGSKAPKPPKKILGMDLNEWMGVLLSGPIDAEVIGVKGGIKIVTSATKLAIRTGIKQGVKSGQIKPSFADDLEILAIARAAKIKPKSTKEAITEIKSNSNMTNDDKINALELLRDNTLVSKESYTSANEAIDNIKIGVKNAKSQKITEDIGSIKTEAERIEKLNNYKATKQLDKDSSEIIDEMIANSKKVISNNESTAIITDESLDLERQYNALLNLKNTAELGEENTSYIESLMENRLARMKVRDDKIAARQFKEAQISREKIYQEEQLKIKETEKIETQNRIEAAKQKAISDQAKQGNILQAQLYEIDRRKKEEARAKLGEGGTITDKPFVGALGGEGEDIPIDEDVEDMDLVEELEIDPRTGLPFTSKFLQDAILGGSVEGPGLPEDTAGAGTFPGYVEDDIPIDDIPLDDIPIDNIPTTETATETTAETHFNKSFNRNTTYQNIDIVLERTVRLSVEVYSTTLFEKENYYILPLEVPVLFHRINNTLYIAFRGTASYNNILSDLLLTTSFDLSSNYLYNNDFFHNILHPTCLDIQFHEGFTRVLSRIYGPIKLEIDKYIKTVANIVLTGHSLGGALAGMFNYMYLNDISPIRLPVRWTVTYGSPRFLFINSYDKYTEKCPHVIRVYNSEDIVTYLPLEKDYFKNITSGYIHVGQILNVIGKNAPNNINNLLTGMIKNNRANITNLTKKKDDTLIFDLFEFLLSTNYLNMVLSGVIECVSTVAIDKDITGLEIESIVSKLNTDMEFITDYSEKCILTKQYGVLETLLNDNINLKNIASNKSMSEIISGLISSYTGGVLTNSVITKEAHSKELYKTLIDNLVNIESELHDDIFEINEEPKKMFYESLRQDNLVYVKPIEPMVYGRVEDIDIEGVMIVEF